MMIPDILQFILIAAALAFAAASSLFIHGTKQETTIEENTFDTNAQ